MFVRLQQKQGNDAKLKNGIVRQAALITVASGEKCAARDFCRLRTYHVHPAPQFTTYTSIIPGIYFEVPGIYYHQQPVCAE